MPPARPRGCTKPRSRSPAAAPAPPPSPSARRTACVRAAAAGSPAPAVLRASRPWLLTALHAPVCAPARSSAAPWVRRVLRRRLAERLRRAGAARAPDPQHPGAAGAADQAPQVERLSRRPRQTRHRHLTPGSQPPVHRPLGPDFARRDRIMEAGDEREHGLVTGPALYAHHPLTRSGQAALGIEVLAHPAFPPDV